MSRTRFPRNTPPRLAGVVLILAMLCGCSQAPLRTERIPPAEGSPAMVVFFVDGLSLTRMEAMLAEGQLPNIRQHFVDGGVRVQNAVTAIPSITYPITVSLLTGLFPGHHGVVGNRWFDRSDSFIRDYSYLATYQAVNDDFTAPTLFEVLDDRLTVTVQANTFRGVTVSINNPIDSALDWTNGRFSAVDARVGVTVERVASEARRRREWPSVYWNYFPGVDEIGHRFGPDSPEYAQALTVADEAIGQIISGVEVSTPTDQIYYALITDHGHQSSPPDHAFDLSAWVDRTQGLRVMSESLQGGLAAMRAMALRRYDAVVINGAFRRGAIFLHGPGGWDDPADPQQVRRLVEGGGDAPGLAAEPAIAVACYREGPRAVRIASRQGRARIERRITRGGKEYRLLLENEADVIGYMRNPALASFIAEGWHDSRAWLAATGNEEFPDFVPQIVELFDSPRAGDVVVFAAGDWSFDPSMRGGHGSCIAADMRIPFFFAGPDLLGGAAIPQGRLVDLMPTILDLIGEGERADDLNLDGISLAPALRATAAASVARRPTDGTQPPTAATRPGSSRR